MTIALVVVAIIVVPIVVGLLFLALLSATLGRRARAGRKAGRYTSRPGNSGDASSSSGIAGT